MRRAPREVYRVHDAEEYLAGVDGDASGVQRDGPVDAIQQGVGAGRRPQQIAGAMIVVAAMGALGAALAVIGLSSIGAGRRARSGALAAGATAVSHAARAHLRHEESPSRKARTPGTRRRDSGRRARRSYTVRRARVFAVALPRGSVQSAPASAVEVADVVAPPPAAHPQPAEFGFER